MAVDETELSFIRCPNCRSLVPAVASRCRMCGYILKDQQAAPGKDSAEESERPSRVRQRTLSVNTEDVEEAALEAAPEEPPPAAPERPAGPRFQPFRQGASTPDPVPDPIMDTPIEADEDDDGGDVDSFDDDETNEASSPQDVVRKRKRRRRKRRGGGEGANPAPSGNGNANSDRQPDQSAEMTPWRSAQPSQSAQQERSRAGFQLRGPDSGEARQDDRGRDDRPRDDRNREEPVRQAHSEPRRDDRPRRAEQQDEPLRQAQGEAVREAPAPQLDRRMPAPDRQQPDRQPEQQQQRPERVPPATAPTPAAPPRQERAESPRMQPADGALVGWLVTFAEDQRGTAHELRAGRFFVGAERLRPTDLVISHNTVSTPQCLMVCDPDQGVTLQDLMSEGGTFVKRSDSREFERHSDQVQLRHGDRVRFGKYEMVFVAIPGAA